MDGTRHTWLRQIMTWNLAVAILPLPLTLSSTVAYQMHVMISRLVAGLRSHCSVLDVQSSCPSADRWSYSHSTKVAHRCYIINVRVCDCSLLTADRLLLFRLPTPSTARLPVQSHRARTTSDCRDVCGVQQSIHWQRCHGCMGPV